MRMIRIKLSQAVNETIPQVWIIPAGRGAQCGGAQRMTGSVGAVGICKQLSWPQRRPATSHSCWFAADGF